MEASLVADPGSRARELQQFQHTGSVAAAPVSRAQARELQHTHLLALWHVGPLQTKNQSCVPWWILNHCITGKPSCLFFMCVMCTTLKMLIPFEAIKTVHRRELAQW